MRGNVICPGEFSGGVGLNCLQCRAVGVLAPVDDAGGFFQGFRDCCECGITGRQDAVDRLLAQINGFEIARTAAAWKVFNALNGVLCLMQ